MIIVFKTEETKEFFTNPPRFFPANNIFFGRGDWKVETGSGKSKIVSDVKKVSVIFPSGNSKVLFDERWEE